MKATVISEKYKRSVSIQKNLTEMFSIKNYEMFEDSDFYDEYDGDWDEFFDSRQELEKKNNVWTQIEEKKMGIHRNIEAVLQQYATTITLHIYQNNEITKKCSKLGFMINIFETLKDTGVNYSKTTVPFKEIVVLPKKSLNNIDDEVQDTLEMIKIQPVKYSKKTSIKELIIFTKNHDGENIIIFIYNTGECFLLSNKIGIDRIDFFEYLRTTHASVCNY